MPTDHSSFLEIPRLQPEKLLGILSIFPTDAHRPFPIIASTAEQAVQEDASMPMPMPMPMPMLMPMPMPERTSTKGGQGDREVFMEMAYDLTPGLHGKGIGRAMLKAGLEGWADWLGVSAVFAVSRSILFDLCTNARRKIC